MREEQLSERRACELVSMSRSQLNYVSRKQEEPALVRSILSIKDQHPYYGVPRVHAMLRRRGFAVNGKKIYRLMKALQLTVGRKVKKKKRYVSPSRKMPAALGVGDVWAMDFVFERLANGTSVRCFTIIDTLSRQVPGIHVAESMSGFAVVDYLERLSETQRMPKHFVLDNGSEFTNQPFFDWCAKHEISIHLIDPGKPVQNAYIESFNGKFRTEFLCQRKYSSVSQMRSKLTEWITHYNEERPHSSLDYLTPKEFADQEARVLDPQKNLPVLKTG